MKNNKILAFVVVGAAIVSCNSGSDGGSGGGGDDGGYSVSTIATLSPLNTPYFPTCIYHSDHDGSIVLVKRDGSGSGVQYFPNNSTVSTISSGLPIITANDTCLANTDQLTWVDNQDNIHVYQGGITPSFDDINQTYNLSATGLSASQIQTSSFASSTGDFNLLFANRNYPETNFGISQFVGLNPTSYTEFPTGNFTGRTNSVIYGFASAANDNGDVFMQQFLPSSGATPATIVTAAHYGGDSSESVLYSVNFVNSNNSAITNMAGAVDYLVTDINDKANYLIQTGLIQPNFYLCNTIVSTVNRVITMSCNDPMTTSLLSSNYKVMRLLSFNGNKIVFYGINLTNQTVGIFSLSKN